MLPQVSFVIPLYNEREVLPQLVERINKLIDTLSITVEVVLIDDGSKDNTAELIQQLSYTDKRYTAVLLARNYGHQLALSAGLTAARGTEAIMVIDGDLQDPPELLPEFYNLYKQGYDVIYAVRKKRKEGFIKKMAYHTFYRILKYISYIDIPLDSGDFSLISRRVVDVLNKMPEESRYIRGMRTWIGFKQVGYEYDRDSRAAGDSKYSFKKLLKLAHNGIFNFSEFPIKLITNLGLLAILTSLIYLIQTIIKKYYYNSVPEGFTALLFAIVLFSGVQLISLGIIGEYVLRIFFQVKGRPLYIIKKTIIESEEKS
jgi:glycosyltransferase involved in cell wall biosynthesis